MDSQALAVRTPMDLIALAVEKGSSADELGKLMELKLRWDANEARLAYIAAMAKFKENAPEILKTHKVRYENKDKSWTEYHHAELDKITESIGEALKAVGITQKWRTGEGENGRIVVTCVLTHEQGHSEDVATLAGPPDASGGKNNIQAIGSTVTYLQRYSLLAGTGLAPEGIDNDGATDGMEENAILDYSTQMQDSMNFPELKKVFEECWRKAQKLNDKQAQDRLRKAYEDRKRELA